MKRSRVLLVFALLLAAGLVGCSSGSECDTCSSDQDCKSGFVCTSFSDGSKRCGSGLGSTQCRVR
jgi:hypothetical protein